MYISTKRALESLYIPQLPKAVKLRIFVQCLADDADFRSQMAAGVELRKLSHDDLVARLDEGLASIDKLVGKAPAVNINHAADKVLVGSLGFDVT